MLDLFFDTETTGFPTSQPWDDASQPDVIQLAAQLYDGRKLVAEFQLLVQNQFATIGEGAKAIHGINEELLDRCGFAPKLALQNFHHMLLRCDRVIAFNTAFDWKLMKIMYARHATEAKLSKETVLCSMLSAVPVVKKPGKYGNYGWPKLQEAHEHMLGYKFEGAHDAMEDVRALARVTHWMEDNNVVLVPPKGF